MQTDDTSILRDESCRTNKDEGRTQESQMTRHADWNPDRGSSVDSERFHCTVQEQNDNITIKQKSAGAKLHLVDLEAERVVRYKSNNTGDNALEERTVHCYNLSSRCIVRPDGSSATSEPDRKGMERKVEKRKRLD